jgi:Ser/Thr protein kinase RdoA (MazF antagonist)
MEKAMECVDSTIAPSAILAVAREVYDVGASATCELLQHHLDATYLVSDPGKSRIVRLFNSRWWTREEVEGEVTVLRHLELRGVRIGAPVPRRDGSWVTTVQAPEGKRQLVAYQHLEGDALVPSRDAIRLGESVGKMHRALEDCVLVHPRRELTLGGLMKDTFDATVSQLSEEHEHRRYLEDLKERVLSRAERVGLSSFREGVCHGDLNFSNAIRQADGEIALYDFDGCGVGILAYDLGVFRWNQWLFEAPEEIWLDFVKGYRRTNELPEQELAGIDLLVLLRQAYMVGHDARRTRIESLGTRWRRVRRTQKMDALRQLDAQLFGIQLDQSW